MDETVSFQGGDFGSPRSSYLGSVEAQSIQLPTFEHAQQVSGRLHTDFQGVQQLQSNSYSGQQGTLTQHQNQGMQMSRANSPTALQTQLVAGQQSGFSGQMGANHLSPFQTHSTSQQSLCGLALDASRFPAPPLSLPAS
ncbi:unnamed protein product [Sphagnum troendelagicum]